MQKLYPEVLGSHAEAPHGCEVLHRLVKGSEDICTFAKSLAVRKMLSWADAEAQSVSQCFSIQLLYQLHKARSLA